VLSGIEQALGDPLDLDTWEATVQEYAQLLVTRPAGALIEDLVADIVAVGEILKRPCPRRAGVRRRESG
jgi:hypothetical protein